jgi:hypothetical protein
MRPHSQFIKCTELSKFLLQEREEGEETGSESTNAGGGSDGSTGEVG